jgi:PAS domain S-box-containing protein
VKDKVIHRLLFFFLGIAMVLLAVAFQAVRNINRSVATSDWVNHTHSVILEAEALRTELYVGDAMMRTYAQSGDARDLAACREALANALDHLDIDKALTRHEPAQHDQIIQIESLVSPRVEFAQALLKARQSGDTEKVRTLLNTDAGSTASHDIQRGIDTLKDEELTLLTERDTASYLQAQTTRWTVWTGVVLDGLLLGGVAWLIRDDLSARRRVAAALQEANDQLETRVRERTAELVAANAQLSSENLERQWANQALEHQLRYNHLIVDSITDLVLILTKALNISRVNPAVIHLTGLDPTALINQPLTRILRLVTPPDDPGGPMRDPLAQALRDGRDLRGQAGVVEDKRGRQIPVHVSMFPLRDRDKIVGGVVTLQLVTPGIGTKA